MTKVVLVDAGAVDGDIEAAEEPGRLVDGRGHRVFVGDIDAHVARMGLAQLGHGGGALVVVEIEQHHLAAVRDQMTRGRQAQAGRAAGDDGAGVGQLHGESPNDKEVGF